MTLIGPSARLATDPKELAKTNLTQDQVIAVIKQSMRYVEREESRAKLPEVGRPEIVAKILGDDDQR